MTLARRRATDLPSLLAEAASVRVAGAAVVSALLWLAVLWAMG